jgi:hypothetical protein
MHRNTPPPALQIGFSSKDEARGQARWWTTAMVVAALSAAPAVAQTVWFVNGDALNGGDGKSWNSPFNDFQDGLDAAGPGEQVWVRASTAPYVPTAPDPFGTGPEDVTFLMPVNVEALGGFKGDELDVNDRAGQYGRTVLSGALTAGGNARHVVTFHNLNGDPSLTILDGFRIEGGDADSDLIPFGNQGGGILFLGSRGRVENCRIRDNSAKYGGGLYVSDTPGNFAQFEMLRSRVVSNVAGIDGGGMLVDFPADSTDNGCWVWNGLFRLNTAAFGDGGGVWHRQDRTDFGYYVNCVLYDNSAVRGGAFFLNEMESLPGGSGDLIISSATVAYNNVSTTDGGGGIYVDAGTDWTRGRIENSILWANTAPLQQSNLEGPGDDPVTQGGNFILVQHSNVGLVGTPPPGAHVGAGNVNVDPLFTNGATRKLTLQETSPMCDAGDHALIWSDDLDMDNNGNDTEKTPLDFRDSVREIDNPLVTNTGRDSNGTTLGAIIDMGAYEADPVPGQQ